VTGDGAPRAAAPGHNLPTPLTSFVGRERHVAELKEALTRTRLATLTGAGGCGKTRLALRVAADLVDRYAHGVWLVELGPLSDHGLVTSAIASTLGVAERPDEALIDTLCAYLRDRSVLLVLDNCEHLFPGLGAAVRTVLQRCPGVTALATSREPIGIAGETTWRVPPLSAPDPAASHPDDVIQHDAVRLFVERARSSRPGFTVTPQSAAAIAHLCRSLDGLPLAIEFAAARVKVLSVEQIAARLDKRFDLLKAEYPGLLPHQQTLRTAMDWSYDLLSRRAQTTLRRLAVFPGGCSLEAATAVCGDADGDETEMIDQLTQLVDKSLVEVDMRSGEARYWLLEIVRQYASDRLEESGEAPSARNRHRDWYLALAERARADLVAGRRHAFWLSHLEREHDNLRAALRWSAADADGAAQELRLAGALHWFWFRQEHWSEARGWLEHALERATNAPAAVLPMAFAAASHFAWRSGDHRRAMAIGRRGLAMARDLADKEAIAVLADTVAVAALHAGDEQRAECLVHEGLGLASELGNRWLQGLFLVDLAQIEERRGNYDRAIALHDQSIAMFQQTEDTWSLPYAFRNTARVWLHQGDHERASESFAQSLRLCERAGTAARYLSSECLEGLASALLTQRRVVQSVTLLGAAEALRSAIGWHLPPEDQALHDEAVRASREVMGGRAFGDAWAAGQAMTAEQAIAYALASAAAPRPDASQHMARLTRREQEVAALVARGLTNREIAARLVISERTAESHVQNIMGKLGVTSRGKVARWAAEHGLPLA
jgi:predicted ATPase/DNA-binding CsgD family transcriptional regulator